LRPGKAYVLGDANIHRALGRWTPVGALEDERAEGNCKSVYVGPATVAIDSRVLLSFWSIRRRGGGTLYGGKFISIQSWLAG